MSTVLTQPLTDWEKAFAGLRSDGVVELRFDVVTVRVSV